MRDREEIRVAAQAAAEAQPNDRSMVTISRLMLEVLLDIRDLLAQPNPTKREAVKQ